MDHADHMDLLRAGAAGAGTLWADLGSGGGAFTLALADLLGPGAVIHSVDRDAAALGRQAREMRARFPEVVVHYHVADLRALPAMPPLDGAVMANALHFLTDAEKPAALAQVLAALRPGGRFILVEYGTDRGNRWVPYPLSYPRWAELAARAGFVATRRLARRPSRSLGEIYSAVSERPA